MKHKPYTNGNFSLPAPTGRKALLKPPADFPHSLCARSVGRSIHLQILLLYSDYIRVEFIGFAHRAMKREKVEIKNSSVYVQAFTFMSIRLAAYGIFMDTLLL